MMPIAIATLATVAIACSYAWWKLNNANILEIAVGPGAAETLPLLRAWERLAAEQPNPLKLRLRSAKTDDEAVELVRARVSSLAAIELTERTSSQLRAVAQLHQQVLLRDRNRRNEPIATFLKRGESIPTISLETVIRQKAKPDGTMDATDESLTEEDRILFWYLGATRTAAENAHWHDSVLSKFQYLVSTDTIDKQVIHDVAVSFQNAMRDLRRTMPVARATGLAPTSDERSILRAHDGVARFVDRESETFFERYGDWVYIGMSALGLIGTVLVIGPH